MLSWLFLALFQSTAAIKIDGSTGPVQQYLSTIYHKFYLRPSINGLVTDGNTKLCCRGFFLALFQSSAAIKIDSEHTHDFKRLLPVCEAEILRVKDICGYFQCAPFPRLETDKVVWVLSFDH